MGISRKATVLFGVSLALCGIYTVWATGPSLSLPENATALLLEPPGETILRVGDPDVTYTASTRCDNEVTPEKVKIEYFDIDDPSTILGSAESSGGSVSLIIPTTTATKFTIIGYWLDGEGGVVESKTATLLLLKRYDFVRVTPNPGILTPGEQTTFVAIGFQKVGASLPLPHDYSPDPGTAAGTIISVGGTKGKFIGPATGNWRLGGGLNAEAFFPEGTPTQGVSSVVVEAAPHATGNINPPLIFDGEPLMVPLKTSISTGGEATVGTCKLYMDTLYLCPNDQGELRIHVTKGDATLYPMGIVVSNIFANNQQGPIFKNNPPGTPSSADASPALKCDIGDQTRVVVSQSGTGSYDVTVKNITFPKRIRVVREKVVINLITDGTLTAAPEYGDPQRTVQRDGMGGDTLGVIAGVSQAAPEEGGPLVDVFQNRVEIQGDEKGTAGPYKWHQIISAKVWEKLPGKQLSLKGDITENEDSPGDDKVDVTPSTTKKGIFMADNPRISYPNAPLNADKPRGTKVFARFVLTTRVLGRNSRPVSNTLTWQSDVTLIKTGEEGDNTWVRAAEAKNIVHEGKDTLDVTEAEAARATFPTP